MRANKNKTHKEYKNVKPFHVIHFHPEHKECDNM